MSRLWKVLTSVAVVLGVTVDGIAVVAWIANGIAVIGEVKLHWPAFAVAGAVLMGLAGPGVSRWYVSRRVFEAGSPHP